MCLWNGICFLLSFEVGFWHRHQGCRQRHLHFAWGLVKLARISIYNFVVPKLGFLDPFQSWDQSLVWNSVAHAPRSGFLKLLQQALRVRPDGLAAFGVPCSSYIFLNCPTHKRCPERPFGDENLAYVRAANLSCPELFACPASEVQIYWDQNLCNICTYFVSRACLCHPTLRIGCRVGLLLLILICRAVYVFVEQPASSRLFLVPYYVFIQDMCGHFGIKFRNSFLSETELYVNHCYW